MGDGLAVLVCLKQGRGHRPDRAVTSGGDQRVEIVLNGLARDCDRIGTVFDNAQIVASRGAGQFILDGVEQRLVAAAGPGIGNDTDRSVQRDPVFCHRGGLRVLGGDHVHLGPCVMGVTRQRAALRVVPKRPRTGIRAGVKAVVRKHMVNKTGEKEKGRLRDPFPLEIEGRIICLRTRAWLPALLQPWRCRCGHRRHRPDAGSAGRSASGRPAFHQSPGNRQRR